MFLIDMKRVGNQNCFLLKTTFDLIVLFFLIVIKRNCFADIAICIGTFGVSFVAFALSLYQYPHIYARQYNQYECYQDYIFFFHAIILFLPEIADNNPKEYRSNSLLRKP